MELLKKEDNSLLLIFIFLAIILLPFNDLPYFGIFGEMSGEGAFYPLLVGIFIWTIFIFRGQKVIIPQDKVFLLLGIFFLWVLVSGAINFGSISENMTKGRTGIEKYLLQVIVLAFCLAVTLFLYNILFEAKDYLGLIQYFALVSLIIAGTYSLVEIAYLFGSDHAKNILEFIDPYIRNRGLAQRLRSVSGEPSWFAMYCSFIMPWIVSLIFTEKQRAVHVFLLAYLIIMIVLTFSRTAYFITITQLGGMITLLIFTRADRIEKRKILALILAVSIGLMSGLSIANTNKVTVDDTKDVVTSFINDESGYAQSNEARLGSQNTAENIGKKHPVFGVGLGQYGFYMADYVPEWAKDNSEIKRWMSSRVGTPWAPVHSIYHRIFAELGYIGLILWLALWALLLIKCSAKYLLNSRQSGKPDYLGSALIICIIGVLMSGLNSDTFRFMGYWMSMAMGVIYIQR